MNDLAFEGRTVLVTGAAGGIGAATAAAFHERGATVYGIDCRRPEDDRIRFLEADVTQSERVNAAVARAAAETGRLDVVVACAGITRDNVLWKLSDESWKQVLAVNLDGAFYVLRAAVPFLRVRTEGGSVVLVSSINGERGKFGQANYAASKAGVIALAKTAARELGRFQVRVNVVAPGFIDTEMTLRLDPTFREAAIAESALGRTGHPDDVARVILFLSSDLARHVTGQVLRVDGGQLI